MLCKSKKKFDINAEVGWYTPQSLPNMCRRDKLIQNTYWYLSIGNAWTYNRDGQNFSVSIVWVQGEVVSFTEDKKQVSQLKVFDCLLHKTYFLHPDLGHCLCDIYPFSWLFFLTLHLNFMKRNFNNMSYRYVT